MNARNGNTRHPREIEADLDRTRAEMGHTLDKLQHKFSPGELFDQGLNYVRANGGGEFASNLRDTIARNPMPVALIGLGFAWLMMSGRRGSVAGDYSTQPSGYEGSEDATPPTLEAEAPGNFSASDVTTRPSDDVAKGLDEASPNTNRAEPIKSSTQARIDEAFAKERVT